MPPINEARVKPDPVAIASQGKVTSQIQTQESSDKPRENSTSEDVPRITSTTT